MIFTDRRLLPLLATTLLVCLVAAGCGDDGDAGAESSSGETRAAAQLTDAEQPPEAFARELAKLVADTVKRKDCKRLNTINQRSLYRFQCPSPEAVRADMAFLKVRDAATFGSGAVVDYKSEQAPQGASMVLFLGPDRQWGVSHFNLITEASAESSDEDSRAGYDEAVAGYLEAVRKQDCDGYVRYAAIAADDERAACPRELNGARRLTDLLNRNRGSKPQYLGGSETYGFYRLQLDKPTPSYMTLVVFKMAKGSLRPFLVHAPTFAPPS